jgi:uncharacterized membrane protein YebE (DUF533 family)
MELLETQDPEKKKLVEASERHKKALEKEVGAMKQKTEKILTNALVIGGALALTYFAVTQLSKRSKKKKNKSTTQASQTRPRAANEDEDEAEENNGPSLIAQIGTKVVNQATLMLLDMAREKLSEYMQNRKTEDEPS